MRSPMPASLPCTVSAAIDTSAAMYYVPAVTVYLEGGLHKLVHAELSAGAAQLNVSPRRASRRRHTLDVVQGSWSVYHQNNLCWRPLLTLKVGPSGSTIGFCVHGSGQRLRAHRCITQRDALDIHRGLALLLPRRPLLVEVTQWQHVILQAGGRSGATAAECTCMVCVQAAKVLSPRWRQYGTLSHLHHSGVHTSRLAFRLGRFVLCMHAAHKLHGCLQLLRCTSADALKYGTGLAHCRDQAPA